MLDNDFEKLARQHNIKKLPFIDSDGGKVLFIVSGRILKHAFEFKFNDPISKLTLDKPNKVWAITNENIQKTQNMMSILTDDQKKQILINQIQFDYFSKCVKSGATPDQAKAEMRTPEAIKEISDRVLLVFKFIYNF